MKRATCSIILIVFTIVSGLLFVSRPASAQGGSVTVQWGDQGNDEQPEKFKKSGKKGGPPPHAPAYGYRAKHQYRYYPCCSAYYDAGRRVWFYIKTGEWTIGASIPTDLSAQLGYYVNISMDTDKPYEFNDEHRKEYPPEKFKKK
jgi:hypothetical protein